MRSINKVILIGNLTRDPELRQTPNGQSVTTFGMATNREWTTKSGEHNNSAEFHECVAWAHLAEICQEYLHKGHLVYVEGYLKTRSWDSPEGIKKFKTEIVVKDMIRLEKRPAGASGGAKGQSEQSELNNEDNFIPEEEGGQNSGRAHHSHHATVTKPASPVMENIDAPSTPVAATAVSSGYDAISEDLGL